MPKRTSLGDLSNELLKDILDFIEADPDRGVPVDRRAYLSVESFRLPDPPPPQRAQDIANFRLTCRKFAEIGAPYQFTRVATRFSPAGLQRLEKIASQRHLAKHTKKFSYIIPFFYVDGRQRVTELMRRATRADFPALDAHHFERKADAQRSIVRSREDARVLRKAMTAFRSLQHVQLLRLQDEADRCLIDYLEENGARATELVDLKWRPACTHALVTLNEALLASRSPFTRFSGPMMNAQSVMALHREIPATVVDVARSLTCLELHFDDNEDLDDNMRRLSGLFKSIFHEASGMQAIHLGFPSRRPLSIGLEEIFHNVQWERLRAFGVQAWRLHADEIIALARRHRRTLRGLRLRDVLLKEGSMWKEVLAMLRAEMDQLDWVSLRRIDYAEHFDEFWAGRIEVPPSPPGGASDSDDEDDFGTHVNLGEGGVEDDIPEEDDEGEYDERDYDIEDGSDFETGSHTSDAHTDHGPDANELALSPDTPASLPFCTCSRTSYPATSDDLNDNGQFVVYHQRKMWEKWVVGRCPEHSHS
ncbi:hypothetical protein MMC25_002544 [Agyrium rufum]|nr:hypothetical protein [Agyrium rufum]